MYFIDTVINNWIFYNEFIVKKMYLLLKTTKRNSFFRKFYRKL